MGILQDMVSKMDYEGLNSIRLLGEIYSNDLQCSLKCIQQDSNRERNKKSDDDFPHDLVDELDYERMDGLPDNEDTMSLPHFRFGVRDESVQTTTSAFLSPTKKFKRKPGYSYGTEVLTFGSNDHPALGQFRSSSAKTASSKGGVVLGRVEEFAVSRCQSGTSSGSDAGTGDVVDQESGVAVSVAAAAHHTLVTTAGGHLYAFGLGKVCS